LPSLQGKLSIDSSVPIAYFLGEKTGELARAEIFQPGKVILFTRFGLAEVFYTLCRNKGMEFARESINTLIQTSYCTFEESNELAIEAASYKCERAISLADCFVIALAKLTGSTAVFTRKEKELTVEMKRKNFDVPVLFLEDLV
jgi:predicted nucleic acid-binding protein